MRRPKDDNMMIWGLITGVLVFGLVFWGIVAFVVHHFLAKYW